MIGAVYELLHITGVAKYVKRENLATMQKAVAFN
jgi:hypothetical protein